MINQIEKALADLRQKKPLVLNLTNVVTMDFVANCLLALGAAPIMSASEDEIEELVKLCSVLYLNIGTLDSSFIALIKQSIEYAGKYNKPIVLDPVGAGATAIRTQTAQFISSFSTLIKGNASEIIALGESSATSHGVESIHTTDEAKEHAILLASKFKNTVIVSGPIDFVPNGVREAQIPLGSALMQRVTGMGCALTSVIAAFIAVVEDPFEAGLLGTSYFGLCGEIASLHHKHSGAFRSAFVDQVHQADFELMRKHHA